MPTLNWIGKEAVVNHHLQVPFHLLKDVPDLACGDPGSGNLIVQGDNLVALKALLPYYAGQVKCIYIDPPYNTGNEGWTYNDNVNSPLIRQWLGKVVGKEAEDLSRHDKWLCMMYPRLSLLRQLLRDDGVLLISIDDFEVYRLRFLLDEVFQSQNFIAQLVWDKTRKNDAKFFSVGHEYLLVYARSLAVLRAKNTVWREPKPGADAVVARVVELCKQHGNNFVAIEKELREWYRDLPKDHPSKKLSRHKHVDEGGVWRDRDISWPGGGGPRYDVLHPVTKLPCKVPERGWGFATIESMNEQIAKGLVLFRADHTQPPFRKSYLGNLDLDTTTSETGGDVEDDEDILGAQVMPSVLYKQAQVSVKLLREIFGGKKTFENPKDHEVIMRLLRYVTKPGDLILDSFAGSGTTGHATLAINKQDGGDRRFILVELEPKITREITSERVRRVAEGYTNAKGEKVEGLGGGFRYCELGESLFDSGGKIRETVRFAELARHVYFSETGEPLPRERVSARSPFLGACRGVGVYLLYNGILGDKSANGGNVLTRAVLAQLPPFDGVRVIYCAGCLLGRERLQAERIVVRQTPYEIKVS
ncbi:MAG: site-specific DNA-methyltransferase [Verrucomicrobiia bacterium]